MSDFLQFIKLLQRNKITLILVPLITVVLSYFLVKRLPDSYESHARIATGMVDKTDQVVTKAKDEQENQIARKFESLIQVVLLNRTLNQVSYKLILHDLKGTKDSTWREPSKSLQKLTKAEKAKAIAFITKKYNAKEELFLWKPYEKELSKLIEDMKYDAAKLREKLIIYRTGSSDYVNISYEAENPNLAAYVVNTLCQEVITDNSARIVVNNKKTIDFLQNFMMQKLATLNERMNTLKNYKIQNRVLNLNEQAKSIYGQMADYETRREIAQKDIVSLTAAIKNIENKFNPADRKYLESALAGLNQQIVASKENLKLLNERYILSNFDSRLKFSLDSTRNKLTQQIDEASDKYIYNPMVVKQELVTRRLGMEISLELAKNSVASIQGELTRLNRKFDGLVPNEAKIQEYETGIDIASKEYIEALQRYNEASLEFSFPIYLRLIERAMPGEVQASKKMVLIILSGLISFAFCVFVFFILFYLDNAIRYPLQLANATDKPVLGYLNTLDKGSRFSLSGINASDEKSVRLYKNLVKSIRFELDNELQNPKMIAVTSLSSGVGKTPFLIALAWAFSRINKTVLIIDGNFGHSDISKLNPGSEHFEHFVTNDNPIVAIPGQIHILSNQGGEVSLLETASEKRIGEKIQALKTHFDIILVETDSLNSMHKAKEWISFVDRVVVVFAAGHSISQADQSKLQYLASLKDKFSGWVMTNTQNMPEQAGKVEKLAEAGA
jgi:succinoglycan biosynthesis transport protein ExoP